MRSVRATLLLTGALVTGCTEYDLKNQSGTPVPGLVLAGDIEATPDVVVGIGCGVLDHDVFEYLGGLGVIADVVVYFLPLDPL